jgi:hypothetical protein
MPTNVYLSQPAITINSVNLTDQTSAATITYTIEALESTALSSSSRSYVGGLQNNEITVTLYQSYAASSTEASIYALVGTTTTVVLSPTAAGLTTPTATSPKYTLTGAYLETHTPIAATLGELSTLTLTFRGGTLTKAVS